MERIDALVIGAGVVGLAVARALAAAGHEVVIAERERAFGTGISSRHSEVIHAGMYYAPGSLKARLCVRGRAMLYDYVAARGVAHRRCGKLIVAADAREAEALGALHARGLANGVADLAWLDAAAARALEPALACAAALASPSTGIVDSHGLMLALLGDAEAAGASLALASPVLGGERSAGGWRLRFGGAEAFELEARWIVNAAGLDAPSVAHALHGFPAAAVPRQHLAQGHYFGLAGRAPFSRLVYPTPVDGGLGIHLTLDLGGQARFGPDVQWLADPRPEAVHYAVDPSRAAAFEASIRRYWPGLPEGALVPAYSGVRPKLAGPGEPAADFRIDGPREHGVPGAVMLFGIESPGLTSCLAIAKCVAAVVADVEAG